MSHGYFESFGQGTFSVYEDNAENATAVIPSKTLGDENQNRGAQVKRTALGNVVNNTRVQPFRAAKHHQVFENNELKGNSAPLKSDARSTRENYISKPQAPVITNQPFSIYCDENDVPSCIESSTSSAAAIDVSSLYSSWNLQTDIVATSSVAAGTTKLRKPLSVLSNLSTVCVDENDESNQSDEFFVVPSNPASSEGKREAGHSERLRLLLHADEYSEEIYAYLRELERYQCPKADYMSRQSDINSNMRCILVDWLVEVAEEYKLHRETLCLAVNYIDRFLSHMAVMRQKLQLLGAASMFLAAKFEEIYPPQVSEFTYITDDSYTKKQVLRMEHLIFKVLEFDIATPTANCFCERFLAQLNADETTHSLAMYVVELSLLEVDPFLRYLPSQLAASAVIVANCCLHHEAWPQSMVQSSGYKVKDLLPCIHALHATLCRAPTHPQQAIREKYKHVKFCQVAMLCPPASLPLPV